MADSKTSSGEESHHVIDGEKEKEGKPNAKDSTSESNVSMGDEQEASRSTDSTQAEAHAQSKTTSELEDQTASDLEEEEEKGEEERGGGAGLEADAELEEPVMEERLKDMCKDMFLKVANYLNGELAVTSEEYKLLQKLNQMSIAKYSDMAVLARRLNDVSEHLNDKFLSLQPYCDQIDQVEVSVSALEQTAYRLDAYCKRLEAKFKELEKR